MYGRYRTFKEMPQETLQKWLDFSYQWHDEEYIKRIKQEFKRRGLKLCLNTF